jgi:hypothetical protein
LAVDAAEEAFTRSGLRSRATCIVGNFFDVIPASADIYLLKSVLHNWDDENALRILRNCQKAMMPGSRLIAIERVIPEGNAPSEAKLSDINMLVVVGGQERTESEYRALFAAAGLQFSRRLDAATPLSLIEAASR